MEVPGDHRMHKWRCVQLALHSQIEPSRYLFEQKDKAYVVVALLQYLMEGLYYEGVEALQGCDRTRCNFPYGIAADERCRGA